jgi:hypothetical protein
MSNFAFLQSEWSTQYGAAIKAEEMATTDPRASCFYARRTLELVVNWLYTHDKTLKPALSGPFERADSRAQLQAIGVGDALFTKAKAHQGPWQPGGAQHQEGGCATDARGGHARTVPLLLLAGPHLRPHRTPDAGSALQELILLPKPVAAAPAAPQSAIEQLHKLGNAAARAGRKALGAAGHQDGAGR